MQLNTVQSTNIMAEGYDPTTKELHIKFKSGGIYSYENVSEQVYSLFKQSPSKGSAFFNLIKGKFNHKKVG